MTYDQQTALVRCLKGAAGSILWILLLSGRTLTAVQLQEATGYSDKPVSQALARLKALGLVAHEGKRRGWRISQSNWQEIRRLVEGEAENEADEEADRGDQGSGQREESSGEAEEITVLTKHNVSTEAVRENALTGAAEESSVGTVKSSVGADETAVGAVVKSSFVGEEITPAARASPGPRRAPPGANRGLTRKKCAFGAVEAGGEAEKFRIGEGAGGRGLADSLRARARRRAF